jgi:hypothetical protein
MIWFNELLRGPAARSPERSPDRSAAAADQSAVDPDTARAALAAATGEEQQRHHAELLGSALAALQKTPLPEDGPRVWAAAVCHVADKSVALQWVGHLGGDDWLGEVAANGRFAEVRLAAAQRIEDREVLRQLAHLSRGKDKAVFRHCSDVLRHHRQAADRAQRAAQLAADLRELLDHAPLSVSCLLDLQRELHELANGSEAPPAECSALVEQAEARLRQESETRRAVQTCRADAAELLAQCTAAAAATLAAEQLDGWRGRLSGLAQIHAGLPQWLSGKASSQVLEASLHQIESRLTALASEREQVSQPEEPAPAPPPEIAAKPQPAAKPQVDLAAVNALLERMEQALEQGHVAEADAAAKQIKAAVAGGALRGHLAARLQRAQARVAELSDWAKWGAQKKREQLIATAQGLLTGSHSVEHLARAVPALREEWKQLNGQPTQAEWGRFDAALEKAYRPVAARHAEEAARRSKARADKEALCAQWEAAAGAIDWEHADYTAVEALRQQTTERWRGAPHAGFRDERALRKRFDKVLVEVDRHLAAAREGEIGRREQLIAAAEALREAPDLRGAINETRTLQQRWRGEAGPMRLARFDEQKLWQRFRSACDAVFERRDAERAEQVAQREKHAQTRAALVDGFAAALAGAEAGLIKRSLAQFRADWEAARTGRGEADALDQRARTLQHQAQRRIEELQRQAYRQRLERMALEAAPAEGADAEALAAGRKEREQLLIDLEIALDLPTPDAFAPARRRRQLERLQVRFRGDHPQQPQAEELLTRLYAVPAGPDAEMDARVAAVVRRLIEQGGAGAR